MQVDKLLAQEKEDILKQYQTFYDGSAQGNKNQPGSSYHSKKASTKKSPQVD